MNRSSLLHRAALLAGALALGGPVDAQLRPTWAEPLRVTPALALQVTGEWQDDLGEEMPLTALSGECQIVAMFCSACQGTCSTTVEAMQWLEGQLSPAARSRCRFVLVTLDPTGDRPEVLRNFRQEQRLSARWTILRGPRQQTRDLANRLGVAFQHEGNRPDHSSAITVIDADGYIVSRHTTARPGLTSLLRTVEQITLHTSPAMQLAGGEQ